MTEEITKDMVVDAPKKKRRTKKTTDNKSTPSKEVASVDAVAEQPVDTASVGRMEVETDDDVSIVESVDVKDTTVVEGEDHILESCSGEGTDESVVHNDSSDEAFHAGDKIETSIGFRLFNSSVSLKPRGRIKGKFYIWDGEVVCGRIRITDSPTGVGVNTRCIGWANVYELKLFVVRT